MSATTYTPAVRKTQFRLKPYHAKDSYKLGHPDQYPENTQAVYSNFTPRSLRLLGIPDHLSNGKSIVLGTQSTIMEYVALWQEEFFDKPLEEILAAWTRRIPAFTGDLNPETERLTALHKLGYLPLHVKALQEGIWIRPGIPTFTIINTNPEFGWLTNSTETYLSNESWKLPTVATIAAAYRRLLDKYAELTGTPKDFVDWQGHCFADRGMSGMMDAAKACAGHAAAFLGSDSVSSVDWIEWFYGEDAQLISGSVPATEHAVMCIGEKLSEKETIRRLIQDIYPTGVVSIVSDTWDFWKVISETALELKDLIMARQPNHTGLNKVVFRPDSGDPVEILCGLEIPAFDDASDLENAKYWAKSYFVDKIRNETDHGEEGPTHFKGLFSHKGQVYSLELMLIWDRHDKEFYYLKDTGVGIISCEPVELTPEQKGAVQVLWEIFGGTITDKGFKLLDQHVGLIYGDSITLDRAERIMKRLVDKGFASGCVVLGIGSYTYQYMTRDSMGHAMKATYGIVDGVEREIFKDPVTDKGGVKKSAKGLLRVEMVDGEYVLYDQQTSDQEAQGELKTIFYNGKQSNLTTWKEIRARLGLLVLNV